MSTGENRTTDALTKAGRVPTVKVAAFRKKVRGHYARYGRRFPWRLTRDPYAIVVSEVMLQQTQTTRVAQRFEGFIKVFPSFQALAQAPLREVLVHWQGLGYNRRAMFLQRLAQIVVRKHHGELPTTLEELRALPGIGPYTAGALLSFVYNKPAVFIETNIRAVFLEEFFPKKRKVRDAEIAAVVERTLDRRNPRQWYYALMDYGVACKKRRRGINVRSAHYLQQPKFRGSVREVRGKMVRLLTVKGRLSEEALRSEVACDEPRFMAALMGLRSDGIIIQKCGWFQISG